MKHNYLTLFFAALLLLCSPAANAHDFCVDDIYYNIISGSEVEVTYEGDTPVYDEYDNFAYYGYVYIPAEVEFEGNYYSVRKIGEYAFYNCTRLTSVNIPYTVYIIKDYAFSSCENLSEVYCEGSIQDIGQYAFSSCENLSEVYCEGSIQNIGQYAFSNCYSLTEMSFHGIISPNTRLEIGAFSSCNTLETITINVNSIGNGCFHTCENLKEIYISANSIGGCPFWGCNKLETIQVSTDCQKYDSRYDCNAIIEKQSNRLISGCKTTIIPDDVEIIGSNSFAYITTFESIEIPKGVRCIEWQAFLQCQIDSFYIPENVKEIGTWSLSTKCLKVITFESATPPALIGGDEQVGISISPTNNLNATLQVPYGAKNAYEAANGWNEHKNIVEIRNNYNATFIVENVAIEKASITEGDSITYPSVPEKVGYTFHWVEAPTTMPSQDITIFGTYIANKYQITYIVDGEFYANDSIAYGETITPIAEPIKEGHTFDGWANVPESMPANDTTVEGTFRINSYTVTFMIDGEVYDTAIVEYGAEIKLPNAPTKEGYTFDGWANVPESMPANDTTIEGTFRINTAIVQFMTNNGNIEIYNLKGEQIINKKELTKGIYIINGKKTYVK